MPCSIDTVIAKILAGEARNEDRDAFNCWLEADPGNRQTFRLLKGYWDAQVSMQHSLSPEKLYGLLTAKTRERRLEILKRRKRYRPAGIVAAAVCIPVAVGFLLFSMLYRSEPAGGDVLHEFVTQTNIDTITLPDHSIVTLNQHSRLVYTDRFNDKDRRVRMEGEALFEVASNPKLPFVAEFEGGNKITVLGTRFHLSSYADRGDIRVTLFTGSVQFASDKNQIVLSPNQQLIFNKKDKEISVTESDTDCALFWLIGVYKYRSMTLAGLMDVLSRLYGVTIRLAPGPAADVTVSGAFHRDQSVDEILTALSKSLPIRWVRNHNQIIINP